MSELRLRRLQRRLTLHDVQAATGVTEGRLSRIERGHVKPNQNESRALARYYRSPIGDLLTAHSLAPPAPAPSLDAAPAAPA